MMQLAGWVKTELQVLLLENAPLMLRVGRRQ